jgi:hypothetical protein
MTKANDPFEEYLRKKKVELLESKFRAEAEAPEEETEDADAEVAARNDDPEVEARLAQEANDFISTGQSAAAELFTKVGSGLSDEKVEEIRDALEEVFEEEAPSPQVEDSSEAFVSFFRQVHDSFTPGQAPEPPRSEPVVGEPAPDANRSRAPEPPHPADISAAAAEVSTDVEEPEEAAPSRADARLDLAEILAPPGEDEDLRQRVDLLSRLVAKLVARAKLSESEIIEVLIKSGVEF